ncbi:Na+/H+ antiporter subunit E [Flaviflexus salsibiostraticola]|uniref:Na+/H+ antiporter subunit E n=1 Tax=Flaviflexus salsibiostraticola TaxID=1282737 RepID=A0A3Q8WVN9_9ACTO|nr:Na+/H+ antiporter subunit E [Flaviflexus salsibiostraticola]AZN30200.1 Na+/H+ antiporter subunit E [Flaviflexus salsibiostraticola]
MTESNARISIRRATYRPGRFPYATGGMLIWLTIVWTLLWGEVSTGNVVAGFLLALLLTTLTPLPAATFDGRFRPLALLRLVAVFIYEIVKASTEIAVYAIMGRHPKGAVIRVQSRGHSDVFLTMLAGMTSLVPGSVVVDVHAASGTLYIHVFDIEMAGGLEAAHQAVLDQEERILRAFASHDQLIDAGFVPGWRMGERLPVPYAPPAGEES